MNSYRLTLFCRFMLIGMLIVAMPVTAPVNGVSAVNARSASNDLQVQGNSSETALYIWDSCRGSIIYLTGTTTSRYRNNPVTDGTIFDRTG